MTDTFINEAAREFEKMEELWIDIAPSQLAAVREKVIRECIEALPHSRPTGVGSYQWLLDQETLDQVRGALNGLLLNTVDPEPPFTLCERTVKMCLQMAWDAAAELEQHDSPLFVAVEDRIESLLPKPDRAAEADEDRKCGNCAWYKNAGDSGTCKRYAPRNCRDEHPEYAKWPWVNCGDLCGEWAP